MVSFLLNLIAKDLAVNEKIIYNVRLPYFWVKDCSAKRVAPSSRAVQSSVSALAVGDSSVPSTCSHWA
jgi:hypothetical protein